MGLGELLDHAAHYAREIAFAQIGREDADGHGAALTQAIARSNWAGNSGVCRFKHPVARLLRNGLCRRGIVEDQGDGGLGKLQVFGKRS